MNYSYLIIVALEISMFVSLAYRNEADSAFNICMLWFFLNVLTAVIYLLMLFVCFIGGVK